MRRDVLIAVYWNGGVFGSKCHGPECEKWIYPIAITLPVLGFYGQRKPNGTFYNARFCSEQCMEDYKIDQFDKKMLRRTA